MTEVCPRCGQTIDHKNDVEVPYVVLLREFELDNILGLWCDIGFVTYEPVHELNKRKHVELDADTTNKIIGFLKLIEHEGIEDNA